jgi:hypothetical protein
MIAAVALNGGAPVIQFNLGTRFRPEDSIVTTSDSRPGRCQTSHTLSRPVNTDYHFTGGATHSTGAHTSLLPLNSSLTEQDFLTGETPPAEERN